ncbi:MAG: 3-dehydroquinate synthase, partial [Desulfobulbaceae bacterium]|nr:3-dehydroquinate synthase [Desulfobulbaceae bacterium]
VYIDSSALATLPRSELLNGLAEVIKYGVIYDADFFQFLDQNMEAVLGLNLQAMEDVIQKCCTIKARVVEADERESNLRRILNFGHTIGHAVEAASDYSMAHGLCVAVGMVAAGELAVAKSMFSSEDAERLRNLITGFGLGVTIPKELDRSRIREYLKTDKKAVSGKPFFILPTTIGKVVITDDVSEELIGQVIR